MGEGTDSKCNLLTASLTEKKLSLNVKKSGFMVINTCNPQDRIDIKLEKGWISYTKEFVYLGVIVTDKGIVNVDVNLHANGKSKSVLIKLANFIRNNIFAPITVKRKVLKACLRAALLYGHETWSSCSLHKIETLFRKAIKITFSINMRIPNEIIYRETGVHELKAEIYRSQYKFWAKIKDEIETDPDTSIAEVYKKAIHDNIHYLRHYKQLNAQFRNHEQCFNHYRHLPAT